MDYTKLREIDVTKHMEKKGKFTYLSWSWAVDTLLQHDPKATWHSEPPTFFQDGSVMVYCTVEAFEKSMTMQMPVLDFKNKAIISPNSFDINTAMQRCLVKAIALYGIGLHIYSGEDLPPDDLPKEPEPYEPTEDEKRTINDICHLIKCAQSAVDMDSVLDEYQEEMGEFGDNSLHDAINDQCREMKAVWAAGNQAQNMAYKFLNIQHGLDEFLGMGKEIHSFTSAPILEGYINKWGYKISALNTKQFNAPKHKNKEGLTLSDRLENLIQTKIDELDKGEK